MSKRILTVLLIAGVLATSNAFASRAREAVMGTGDAGMVLHGGSFFYDSNYNIFYNPSYVNDYKNWAIIEKYNGSNAAQGGFVASMGSFNFGAYMNRASSFALTHYLSTTTMRPIELFFGGETGIKWGASLSHASNTVGDNSDTDMALRLGAQVMDFDPFLHVTLRGSRKLPAGSAEAKGSDITIGTKYKMGEWTPYVAYRRDKVSDLMQKSSGVLGLGRNHKIAEGTKMYYALALVRDTLLNRTIVPIDFSVDTEANSWLTLRAGLAYRLMDQVSKTTQADSTTGRVGASIHYGKASFDWAIGSTAGAENPDGVTFDVSNGFFTASSLSYHW